MFRKLNEDNYEMQNIHAKTKEELLEKVYDYLYEHKLCAENGYYISSTLAGEDDEEEYGNKYDNLEKWITVHFDGENDYDICGLAFGNDAYILSVKECNLDCIDTLVDYKELSFINKDFILDKEKWKKDLLEADKCKYIYFVSYLIHTSHPNEYELKYEILSDIKLDENAVYDFLKETHNIEISEFNMKFGNHILIELEDFMKNPEMLITTSLSEGYEELTAFRYQK